MLAGSAFNVGHVKPCVVSCFRSTSEKVLNDECPCVFVRVGIQGQRLFWSSRSWPRCTLASLHVATWWCKSPLQPLSCLTAPPHPTPREDVTCFPPPRKWIYHADNPSVSPVLTTITSIIICLWLPSPTAILSENCNFYDVWEGFPFSQRPVCFKEGA